VPSTAQAGIDQGGMSTGPVGTAPVGTGPADTAQPAAHTGEEGTGPVAVGIEWGQPDPGLAGIDPLERVGCLAPPAAQVRPRALAQRLVVQFPAQLPAAQAGSAEGAEPIEQKHG